MEVKTYLFREIAYIYDMTKDKFFRNYELLYNLRSKDIYNWDDRLNDMEKVL